MVSTLQHEKSIVFDNTPSSVFDIALHNRSLLITSSNDIVQNDIEIRSIQRRFELISRARNSSNVIM